MHVPFPHAECLHPTSRISPRDTSRPRTDPLLFWVWRTRTTGFLVCQAKDCDTLTMREKWWWRKLASLIASDVNPRSPWRYAGFQLLPFSTGRPRPLHPRRRIPAPAQGRRSRERGGQQHSRAQQGSSKGLKHMCRTAKLGINLTISAILWCVQKINLRVQPNRSTPLPTRSTACPPHFSTPAPGSDQHQLGA